MKKEKLYISTISMNNNKNALKYNIGLEIAEFCTAYNMDDNFEETIKLVNEKMKGVNNFTFHFPFNELSPSAIDPKVKKITLDRYIQALHLARELNIKKMIIHSGFIPLIYFKEYFVINAIDFFRNFMTYVNEDEEICLENVMEDDPSLLIDICKGVNDKRFGLCLDIGHANCTSTKSVNEWLIEESKYIKHFHIHNNYSKKDEHNPLDKGNIDILSFISLANNLCEDATYTIENMDEEDSIKFLIENGVINE